MSGSYDLRLVALSILVTVIASGVTLFFVSRRKIGKPKLIFGSLFPGAGILGMHYTGMAAASFTPGGVIPDSTAAGFREGIR